jgi:hypothetical protein
MKTLIIDMSALKYPNVGIGDEITIIFIGMLDKFGISSRRINNC